MMYSSRRKEVDMKKVIMIIAVAAILVGCKGKGTRVQISDSVDKFKVEKLFVVDSTRRFLLPLRMQIIKQ